MTIKVTYNVTDVYVTQDVSPVYINVSYSGGGSGGAAVWGGITGTLSDQTDLQNALNAKFDDPTGTTAQYLRGDGSLATFPSLTGYVPYTGATGAVNLGVYDLTVNELTIGKGLNSVANNTALGKRTLFHTTTGNYNTAVGHEAGHNLTTGQYNTAIGQSAMFTATSAAQNTAIGVNALLLATSGGSNVAVGLDSLQHITTGSSNTAIGYNAGSHITGGSTPNTTATNSVFIGRDSKANADGQTNQIVIGQNAVGNGSNTATFGNTATTANYFTGSINGGSFVKSGGTSSQFLKADGTVDSSVYVPTSRELTINGVTFDLSANRTFTVGSVTGSGATGQIAYWNGTNSQTGSNNLFWDNANSRLGIGTNVPTYKLQVVSASGSAAAGIGVINNGTGTSDFASYNLINNSNLLSQLFFTGSNYTLSTMIGANGLGFYNEGSGGITIWAGNASGSIKFATGVNVTSGSEKMSLYSNGNLGIGTGNTDSGERLQVTGTTRLNGVLTVTAPSGYIAQSFKSQYTAVGYLGGDNTAAWVGTGADGLVNSILCGTTTNYVSFRVNNAQRLIVQSTGNVSIGNSNDTYRLDVSGSIRSSSGGIISTNTSSASDAFYTLLSSNIRFYVSAGGYCKTTSNIVTDTNGTTSLNASAILQADSTTKGFLPPRMTTTQKNAISSPAAGLVVYDTTLNKLCVYTTAWETITSI
jgi:hypothetical protein